MIKFSVTTTVIFSILLTSNIVYSQAVKIPKNYNLVFYDEFDKRVPSTIINDKLWSRTPEWNQDANRTNSMSWCIEGADTIWDKAYIIRKKTDTTTVKVSNGTCKLLTDSADYRGEIWNWPNGVFVSEYLHFKFRTGMLYSNRKFKYGYFEIKFRLPAPPASPYTHQGFGPNFWLFGADKPNNNYYSEIDIFEINAYGPKTGRNLYTTNVHYSDKDTSWHPTKFRKYGNVSSSEWHIASCLWTRRFIKIYLNGELIIKVRRSRTIPVHRLAPLYMLVNINSPASNYCTNFDPVYTAFPYVYEIDYIRVYQKK